MMQAYARHVCSLLQAFELPRWQGTDYYRNAIRRGINIKVFVPPALSISSSARDSFAKAFGVTVTEQLEFERLVESLTLSELLDPINEGDEVLPLPVDFSLWTGRYIYSDCDGTSQSHYKL